MLERYLIPIAPYLLIAAGLILSIYVFYLLKQEIHRLERRLRASQTQAAAASAGMTAVIEEMRAELHQAEERTSQMVPPPPPRSGLNLNKRTQVIRMFRHGEDAEEIARKLGLPRNEVLLLLKVHSLAVNGTPFDSDGTGLQNSFLQNGFTS